MKPRLLILLNRLAIGGPASNTLALAAALSNNFDILIVAGKPMADELSAAYLLETYKGFQLKMVQKVLHLVLIKILELQD